MSSQLYADSLPLERYLAASSISALTSRIICHPFDTIKINFQESSKIKISIPHLYRGFIFSSLSTIPALSLFLVAYENSKFFLLQNNANVLDSSIFSRFKTHMLAAGIAEVQFIYLVRLRSSLVSYGLHQKLLNNIYKPVIQVGEST